MAVRAFVTGCETTSLSDAERSFITSADPWGLTLFARNCASPEQVERLTGEFRMCVGRDDAPVLIDQEGGRVQRLKPPHWRAYPSGLQVGALYGRDRERGIRCAFNCARLMAEELLRLGITVDCLPVLDVPAAGAHQVIGDRAYGTTPDDVIELGRAVIQGVMAAGVLPVMKHIPGHGRAGVDSHKELPVVTASRDELAACDFVPFHRLNDCPLAMTAHVVYSALDPDNPATLSKTIISDLIRGELGFDGVLLSDDIGMHALSGSLRQRTIASHAAGCDIVLHCSGILSEMEEVAAEVHEISGQCAERVSAAMAMMRTPDDFDVDEALSDLDLVLRESV